jgi:hypothetical protein
MRRAIVVAGWEGAFGCGGGASTCVHRQGFFIAKKMDKYIIDFTLNPGIGMKNR